MACSDVISHASLGYFYFFTDKPQNPWQMLGEPWGSAEPWLKITDLPSFLLEIDLSQFPCAKLPGLCSMTIKLPQV